jgi:hypothetical protein
MEFAKTIKKQRAIKGEFKKTKMRTKLRKSAPELFSVVDSDNYLDVNTDTHANVVNIVDVHADAVNIVDSDADAVNIIDVDVDADPDVNIVDVNTNDNAKKNSLYIDYGNNINLPNIKSTIAKRFKRKI